MAVGIICAVETNATHIALRPEMCSSNMDFRIWVRINEIPGGEYEGTPLASLPADVPRLVPREQAYYWTKVWQEGERKSRAEYEAGNYVEFDGSDLDAIRRWLEAPEEEGS